MRCLVTTVSASLYGKASIIGEELLATKSIQLNIDLPPPPPTISIWPPVLKDAEVGEEYTFNFAADDIPSSIEYVEFTWTFGEDASEGSSGLLFVTNSGKASYSTSHTFSEEGTYEVVVNVEDTNGNVLTNTSATVVVKPIPGPRDGVLIVGNSESLVVESCSPVQFVARGDVAQSLEVGNIVMNIVGDNSICQECLPLIRRITNITDGPNAETKTFSTAYAALSEVFEESLYDEIGSDVEVEKVIGCNNDEERSLESIVLPRKLDEITSCSDWQTIDGNGDCKWTDCNVGVDGDPVDCFQCRDQCDNGCGSEGGIINHSGDFTLYDFGPACCSHDFCYSSYFSKSECDFMFYMDMLKACPIVDVPAALFVPFPIGMVQLTSCQGMALPRYPFWVWPVI